MNSTHTPAPDGKGGIFISYSHKDAERVIPQVEAMRARGYRVWYDAHITPGDQWTDTIAEEIENCAIFLPFLSDSFPRSKICMREFRYANSCTKRIIPVWLVDKHRLSGKLQFQLEDYQGYTLTESPDAFAAWMDTEEVFTLCRTAAHADTAADTAAHAGYAADTAARAGYAADTAGRVRRPAQTVTRKPVEPSESFVGREDVLHGIAAAFRDGAAAVNLYGMGGIGKSEICRKFFQSCTTGAGTDLADWTGWVTWRGTLEETFYAQFPEIKATDFTAYWREAEAYLRRNGNRLLIVLDNGDGISDRDAARLTRLGCRLLVTSRPRLHHLHPIHAGSLPPEQCRLLYRRALCGEDAQTDTAPDPVLDEILRLAGYHTLTVELLAKTQRAANLTTQKLLDRLKESGFDLSGVEESISYSHRPETEDPWQENGVFIEHMAQLFDLSTLRETPKKNLFAKIGQFFGFRSNTKDTQDRSDALEALRGMSLLSPNSYLPLETARRWLNLRNLNGLNYAVNTGWLNERTEPDGTRSVSIHPVIAAVVRRGAPPEAETVDALAGQLAGEMTPEVTEIFTRKLWVMEHAAALYRVAEALSPQTENYGWMLHQMGYLTAEQGDYDAALEWYHKALRIRETVLGKDHPSTATTYHNIAGVYWAKGDYAAALEWYHKALRILETVLGKDHPDTATTYHNIALVYKNQGDYDAALEWFHKARQIYETVLGKDHPSTATTYNNIALVYKEQGDYAAALEWYHKALRISEKVLGKDHPSTATTYNNIAGVYWAKGDYDAALEWYHKALRIRETALGKDHPHTATTYNNIALVYDHKGDYDAALEWFQKALRIWETVLGKDHPSTATTYHNIGTVYFEREQYEEALQWLNKALAIRLRVLGENHPSTKVTKKWIALIPDSH